MTTTLCLMRAVWMAADDAGAGAAVDNNVVRWLAAAGALTEKNGKSEREERMFHVGKGDRLRLRTTELRAMPSPPMTKSAGNQIE